MLGTLKQNSGTSDGEHNQIFFLASLDGKSPYN